MKTNASSGGDTDIVANKIQCAGVSGGDDIEFVRSLLIAEMPLAKESGGVATFLRDSGRVLILRAMRSRLRV